MDTQTTSSPNSAMVAPSRSLSAFSGVVAGGTGLAVAGLLAGTDRRFRSPIVDVGDVVIDRVPLWLKDIAIALFGTNDKRALLVGMAIMLTGAAAGIGILALRRHLLWGMAAFVALGLVGAVAALDTGTGWLAPAPAIVGSLVGAGVLLALHRSWYRADSTTGPEDTEMSLSRRRMLTTLGGSAVAGVVLGGVGQVLERRFDVDPSSAVSRLPAVRSPLPAHPAGVDLKVPGLSSFVTDNDDFYRIDTALAIPRIRPEEYELRIHGMVDRPLTLSYADLIQRAHVEADITLTCVSNEVGGNLVGNARWQGVPLTELLDEVGVDSAADQVVGRSYDDYTCGFPVTAATDGRQALVAVGMNGEPLPLIHGFPVRLVVPGLYGYVSATKWLAEIELTTFEAFDHYWERRGWGERAPIKTQSRIDTPRGLSRVAVGDGVIAGVAWAQTRGIERVEIRIDDEPWRDADLGVAVTDTTWRQWSLRWDVAPGRHTITCRATDSTGETQTDERQGTVPDGATGWHQIVVTGVEALATSQGVRRATHPAFCGGTST